MGKGYVPKPSEYFPSPGQEVRVGLRGLGPKRRTGADRGAAAMNEVMRANPVQPASAPLSPPPARPPPQHPPHPLQSVAEGECRAACYAAEDAYRAAFDPNTPADEQLLEKEHQVGHVC